MPNAETAGTSCDVAIIGAGPAGTMAAALLHKAGHDVRIFEKERFPRFVIGESLLPRCMDLLDEADLLEDVQRQGYLVKKGAVFLRDDARCTFDFSEQFTASLPYTWQVPRAHFDDVLAKAVQARGVPIHFETAVTEVDLSGAPRMTVRGLDGVESTVRPRFVIDASGYGRVLPRMLDLDIPSTLPTRESMFTHVKGDRRPSGDEEGRIWITIHRQDAWSWIIPFSDGVTSVGIVGPADFFAQFPEDPSERMRAVLNGQPATAERLQDAEILFEPHVIKGYSIGVKKLCGENFCLVGNATEFLDPVFSSGVTLAFETAARGAKLADRQLRGETVDWTRDYAQYVADGVATFRTYIDAWYDGTLPKLFFQESAPPTIKRMVCSILAGYVWDNDNPFVAQHAERVAQLRAVAG